MSTPSQPAPGADSFPRQSARTRRFTLGVPRDIKVAPDGSRILFLRSASGSDPINRLWQYEVASSRERELVDPTALLAGTDADDLPEAERRRRERARELGAGIVSYDVDEVFSRAVFALAGRVFVVDLDRGEVAEWPSSGSVFDPRFDPTGRCVAYVSGAALHVTDGAADRQLVADPNPTVSWGSAEFVAAEEMHRSRGFWWSPDGQRLLVERVDQAPVPIWHIASPITPEAEPVTVRYPAAGSANVAVELFMIGLDGSRAAIDWSRGEFEYLCDVSWAPREHATIVAQTRDQRAVSIGQLSSDGTVRELRRLSDGAWVDLVPGSPAFCGDRLMTVEVVEDCYRLCCDGEAISPPDVQVRRIVTTTDSAALVVAATEPTEAHVASIALDGTLAWLSTATGVHSAVAAGQVRVLITQSLDADRSSIDVLVDGRPRGTVRNLAETPLVAPRVELLRVGERQLRSALVLPTGFNGETQLPVLVDPYGGPGHARVLSTRSGFLTSQWFADQGFAVLITDGRGTPGRGPRWDRAIKGDFATPVLDDQVDALREVAESRAYLDLTRVAIRGWSFGGYLAALAVLRRPDVFHAAVAGAPVTDWRLYDTHYTERYLGDPDRDGHAYQRSSLIDLAQQLERPLLLIHGLADDNVVVAHTLALSRALLEAGRPHRVLPLSGVTHMTPQEVVAENLLNLEVDFFRETLAIDTPKPAYRWRPMLPRRDSPL